MDDRGQDVEFANDRDLKCSKCDVLLEAGKFYITYMNSVSGRNLKCPKCGLFMCQKRWIWARLSKQKKD